MRPGVIPAPRRWVMVGCLQGRRGNFSLWIVNKGLTVAGGTKKSSRWAESGPPGERPLLGQGYGDDLAGAAVGDPQSPAARLHRGRRVQAFLQHRDMGAIA